ncbi:MAG: hypothetical protein ACLRHJ_05550 [Faecalimonas umbilicata]|uniref:hypothetical protein n=1 Tax=Faecalimonas umbilicata TaxID=1912855 RepID=UPI0039A0E12E
MYKKKSDVYSQHVSSVLEFIYRKQKTSRIEIANATGLTPALMTEITGDLKSQNLIIEIGDEISNAPGSGRKRKLLTLNASAGYLIGIELNMRGIFFVITDLSGKVITEAHETFSSYDVNNINSEIVLQLNLLLKKSGSFENIRSGDCHSRTFRL